MNYFKKRFHSVKSQSGVTLLFVIIAMLVLAVIGTGLFALFSTSRFNQAAAQKKDKAYYLAESGIRIVAGELHASTNQITTLLNLQGKTFNLSDVGGNVTLQLYPYWFYVNSAYSANATSITLYYPGKLPPINSDSSTQITIPGNGILKLKNYTKVGVFTGTPSAGSFDAAKGTPLTFSGLTGCFSSCTSGFPYAISSGSELYLGYLYNSPQTIVQGDDLILDNSNSTAELYPPENGSIYVALYNGIFQYTYESRIPQTIDHSAQPSTFTLHNIQPAAGVAPTPIFPFVIKYSVSNLYDVTKTTPIFLGKTLAIQSKSECGN
jgi:type II secretory pathway pseudopilin PulG